ncbi:MAG TPA: hypothetical protein VFX30_03935 [bacterium]|nr:hypothetical protein [bacterium]
MRIGDAPPPPFTLYTAAFTPPFSPTVQMTASAPPPSRGGIVLPRRIGEEEVVRFFGRYPWTGSTEERYSFLDKKPVRRRWLEIIQRHDPKVFEAVMQRRFPSYRTRTLDAFVDEVPSPQICKVVEEMEAALFRVHFGLSRVPFPQWPWYPWLHISRDELYAVFKRLHERTGLFLTLSGDRRYDCFLMAAALYPDRFTYFTPPRVLPTGGYEARLRGFSEEDGYRTRLTLQSRIAGEILALAHADNDRFRGWVQGLLAGATMGLTPDEGQYPLLISVRDFSDAQKKVLLEEILAGRREEGRGDFWFYGPEIRLKLLIPEAAFRKANPRVHLPHIVIKAGTRYVEVIENYRVGPDRKISG